MKLISIDPGDRAGQALYSDGELVGVGDDPRRYALFPDVVVIECPYIYPQRVSKANPNDMIVLALKVGGLAEFWKGAEIVLPKPREWNGGAKKAWTEARVWMSLTASERDILRKALGDVAPSRRNNLVDAVAIGLWYLTTHTKLR